MEMMNMWSLVGLQQGNCSSESRKSFHFEEKHVRYCGSQTREVTRLLEHHHLSDTRARKEDGTAFLESSN